MDALNGVFGSIMLLLLSISIVLAIAMLVLFQARSIVGLAMQLYWRWKASIRLLRDEAAEGERSRPPANKRRRPDPQRNGPPHDVR